MKIIEQDIELPLQVNIVIIIIIPTGKQDSIEKSQLRQAHLLETC